MLKPPIPRRKIIRGKEYILAQPVTGPGRTAIWLKNVHKDRVARLVKGLRERGYGVRVLAVRPVEFMGRMEPMVSVYRTVKKIVLAKDRKRKK